MIQRIERLLKSLVESFLGLIRSSGNDLGNIPREIRATNPMDPAKPEVGLLEPLQMDEPPPLALEPPMILVECTSCGSVNELKAVCQTCRRPVCSDGACQSNIYDQEMESWVIQCANCASST